MQIGFKLPFEIKKEDDWYIASCPVLDVHSQGKTEKQAKKNLVEALYLFLISCFQRGTIDDVLKECGFEPGHSMKKPDGTKYLNVEIPFDVKDTRVGCHA
jgi:predicted RNase H-like HicB family nuclease